MSLMSTIVKLVGEREHATVEELMPYLDGYTERQVRKAFQNLSYTQRLYCEEGRHAPGVAGSLPGVFRLGVRSPEPEAQRLSIPRVNSVFALGACV